MQIFFLDPFLKMPRYQVFEYFLADVALELLPNQACRRFAWTKTGQLGLRLERGNHLPGLALHLVYRNRDV